MKTIFISLLFTLFTNISVAGYEDWDKETKSLYILSNLVIMADWATTRDITRRYNEGYHEKNPILGRDPLKADVDLYFLGAMIANYYFTDYLNPGNRKLYLTSLILIQYNIVLNNTNIGLRIRF